MTSLFITTTPHTIFTDDKLKENYTFLKNANTSLMWIPGMNFPEIH